jgi:hypothetical protein
LIYKGAIHLKATLQNPLLLLSLLLENNDALQKYFQAFWQKVRNIELYSSVF